MSIQPKYDQTSAPKNSAQIASSSDFATGDGGVTRISSAAGKNSRSAPVSCDGWRGISAVLPDAAGFAEGGSRLMRLSLQVSLSCCCMLQSRAYRLLGCASSD